MNLVCPLCGAMNDYLELGREPGEQSRVYVCLSPLSDTTRCCALFSVTITGVWLSRPMTPAELEQLAESDRSAGRGRTFEERAATLRMEASPVEKVEVSVPEPDPEWPEGQITPSQVLTDEQREQARALSQHEVDTYGRHAFKGPEL
jgi:hypothetical protein